MSNRRSLRLSAVAALCLACSAAQAAAADRYVCKRKSGGPMSPIGLEIDYGARTVALHSSNGLDADPNSVAITDTFVTWSVMRGGFVFNRRTRELRWDMIDEYEYLAAIGHPSSEPAGNFRGRMQCRTDPTARP